MQSGWVGSFLAQVGEGAGEAQPGGQQPAGGQAGQQQPGAQQPGQKQPAAKGPDMCPPSMFIPLGIIFVLFYFLMLKPQRRQEQQRRELLGALKKNDRVVTAGGIYGVVTNVNPTRDEVTLRIDDDTNTKIRVTRGSIQQVITSEEAAGDKG
jgi:preprotein translocase YajC subunit